ncbi:antifreeze protein [Mycena olivaceomarginata]|nr:antifreeze protein [Mycena olivaceomarginata]
MISTSSTLYFLTVLGSVVALGPAAVNLRTAANYAILAKAGVSTLPPSVITGNVAVVGKVFAASYAPTTPATLSVAVGDMGTAFTDATGRVSPNFMNLGSGAIGGLVLTPGLYKWTSAVYHWKQSDTWIFQVTGTLSIGAGQKVVLAGGALSSNIVWVVTGAVSAAAGAHLEGVILGQTSITLLTGATANSRLLRRLPSCSKRLLSPIKLSFVIITICGSFVS